MMDLVGDHLWKWTPFAVAAALLASYFRKNAARVRYSPRLNAPIQFLIAFSLFLNLLHPPPGLKLVPDRVQVEYIVIDSVDKPAEN
jgi:hypothetical protein